MLYLSAAIMVESISRI